jgi:hypothetical protein
MEPDRVRGFSSTEQSTPLIIAVCSLPASLAQSLICLSCSQTSYVDFAQQHGLTLLSHYRATYLEQEQFIRPTPQAITRKNRDRTSQLYPHPVLRTPTRGGEETMLPSYGTTFYVQPMLRIKCYNIVQTISAGLASSREKFK